MRTTAATATAVRPRTTRGSASRRVSAAFIAAFAIFTFGAAGCDGPCNSLAERICSCEINGSQEQSCLLRIQRAGERETSTEEAERCSNLLDTCDCQALDREDYAACGLTNNGR